VIAPGPGLWADPQRAATDVAAAVRLTGAPDRASAGGSTAGPWLAEWRGADAAALAAASAALDAWPGGELSEPEVARELVAALPADALLWCGNSLSVRDLDLALPPRADARVMASRGASGIDGTFSTAAGAALAHAADHPGTVAFALIGDLSLLHDAPGLSIGPGEPRPDLCVIVVNNDGGGIFEGLEPARFGGGVSGRPQADRPQTDRPQAALTVFERTFGTPHGASIEHLAAAFGLPYTLAERPGEIAKAVAATVPGSGPRIVEARTSRAPNADLRAHLSAAALAALAAPRSSG
jgi:2-succinyl-5-enolpyruvyl-6-hydroxy-3-cyclohexene-1-carboxylate synthase